MEPGELSQVSAQALAARIPELDVAIGEPRLFDRVRRYDSTPADLQLTPSAKPRAERRSKPAAAARSRMKTSKWKT